MKYIFLLFLIPSTTLQASWVVTKAKFGIYTVQQNNDLEGTFSLESPEGKVLTTLKNVDLNNSRLLSICNDEIFWKESPPPKDDKPSIEELWSFKVKTGVKTKILESEGFSFKISSSCNKIIIENKSFALEIFDRNTKKSSIIARTGEGGSIVGFNLFGWSKDEKLFWLASAVPGNFVKIAVYENGKTTWFQRDHATDDYNLDLDEGLLAHSNRPFTYDEEGEREYLKKSETTVLKVLDIRADKEIEIARGTSNKFEPRWDTENLQYTLNSTVHKISNLEIRKILGLLKTK